MEKTTDLLAKIKAAKDAKHLSYQDIVELTEQNGEAVSLSTIKRFFAKEAKIEDFRYNQTIRPIVRAVLGIDEDEVDVTSKEDGITTIEAMKALIDFKHEQYEELRQKAEKLQAELDSLHNSGHTSLEKVEAEAQKKIDFLRQIIEDLKQELKWYKKAIAIVVACFASFAFAVGVYVFIRFI